MPAVTPTLIMGVLGIVLSAPAWVLFIRAARRLYLFIAAGQPAPGRTNRLLRRGVQVLKEVFFHTELMRRPAIAVAHWFVMVGFLIGSLVWFEAYIQTFNPAGGWPLLSQWSLYHFAEEVLAIGTVLGIGFLFTIRLSTGMRERLSRFYGSNALSAFFVEGVIFLEGAGMLLVKAGKIATYGHASLWADFFTQYLAQFLPASPIMVSVFALFKLLVGMVWLVVVARNLTWGVAWHRFLAFFNIFFQRNPDGAPALGKVLPLYDGTTELTIDTIEEDSSLGIGHLQDASWKMLLDAATCTECGRCQTQCPSWNTGKPLSPKLFVTDIRDAAVANASYLQDPDTFATDTTYSDVDLLKLVGESNVIHPDVLWSCTNCGACVEQCPVDIEHIDHVVNMRRFQVLAESDFPSELVGMFKNLEVKGNPWGRNNAERASWITEARRDGIEVPVFGEDAKSFDDIEYLFWVGCAGAFDDDGKRTTRAVVELLHTAGVKFAVLSKAERCTGDPARRAGNEFLFQQLALENIDTLNGVFSGVPKGQRKIITIYETDHGIRTGMILSQTSEIVQEATPTIIYQGAKVIGRTLPEDGPLSPIVEKPSVEIRIEETDFTTEYRDSANLPKGQTKVLIAGEKGQRTILTEISSDNGVETRRELSNTITKEPIHQVVLIGTKAVEGEEDKKTLLIPSNENAILSSDRKLANSAKELPRTSNTDDKNLFVLGSIGLLLGLGLSVRKRKN